MLFSNGLTIAVFQLLRNDPDCKDWFMMFVIIGRMLGKMLFSNVFGMGSSSHNLDFVFIISFITCSSLNLLN